MKFTIVDGPEHLEEIEGAKIPRATVHTMVNNHRKNDPNNEKLWYAHFSLQEVLDMFVTNEVLPEDLINKLKEQATIDFVKPYGFKIYLGKYASVLPHYMNQEYKNRVTPILCNTEIIKDQHYKDILKSKKNLLLMPGKLLEDTPYLDQANICPPPAGGPTLDEPKCEYDVSYPPCP
jgi:hypothetical protein